MATREITKTHHQFNSIKQQHDKEENKHLSVIRNSQILVKFFDFCHVNKQVLIYFWWMHVSTVYVFVRRAQHFIAFWRPLFILLSETISRAEFRNDENANFTWTLDQIDGVCDFSVLLQKFSPFRTLHSTAQKYSIAHD